MSICKNCGAELPKDALFCESCGTRLSETEEPVYGRLTHCPDGVYRWVYEFHMLKNPTILFTILKVLAISASLPALITLFSALSDGFFRALGSSLYVYLLIMGIFAVLTLIGYLITAAVYGGKYIVLFEMDEQGIAHIQQDRQFRKAQALGYLAVKAGYSTGKPGVAGTGLLVAGKRSTTSEFRKVSRVICLRRRNTIKVNQLLAKNQIYVDPGDYEFVRNYIISHCDQAKIRG